MQSGWNFASQAFQHRRPEIDAGSQVSLRNEDGGTRILRIITRLNVGGPAQHVIFLTEQLQKAGWPSLLVSGREDET